MTEHFDSIEQRKVLGVDFGGVISQGTARDADTSFFGDNFLETPATEGSFEVLAALNTDGPYAGNVHVVSKCGPEIERKTRLWLEYHGFHEQTGIPVEHLHFTPNRQGKEPIARALGVTAFIDDKLEVLGIVAPSVPNLFLFNPSRQEVEPHAGALDRAVVVNNWEELQEILIERDV